MGCHCRGCGAIVERSVVRVNEFCLLTKANIAMFETRASSVNLEKVMKARFKSLVAVLLITGSFAAAVAQNVSDQRVGDLIQAGTLRAGLFSSQFRKDPTTGELRGVRPDMARALAARIGVEAVLIEHPSPQKVIECLKQGACDVAFLPKDARAANIADFSFPFIQSEFTFLVPAGSTIHRAADADEAGIRIAAIRGHASAASLTSIIKQSQIVVADSESAALELLRDNVVQAIASTRQSLSKDARELAGSRVLTDHYGVQLNRAVVPKGKSGWLAYINEFVEEAKANGSVRAAIEREGTTVFDVAAPGESQ
jgi:polar amino acid transport system substrate-binding protein